MEAERGAVPFEWVFILIIFHIVTEIWQRVLHGIQNFISAAGFRASSRIRLDTRMNDASTFRSFIRQRQENIKACPLISEICHGVIFLWCSSWAKLQRCHILSHFYSERGGQFQIEGTEDILKLSPDKVVCIIGHDFFFFFFCWKLW